MPNFAMRMQRFKDNGWRELNDDGRNVYMGISKGDMFHVRKISKSTGREMSYKIFTYIGDGERWAGI